MSELFGPEIEDTASLIEENKFNLSTNTQDKSFNKMAKVLNILSADSNRLSDGSLIKPSHKEVAVLYKNLKEEMQKQLMEYPNKMDNFNAAFKVLQMSLELPDYFLDESRWESAIGDVLDGITFHTRMSLLDLSCRDRLLKEKPVWNNFNKIFTRGTKQKITFDNILETVKEKTFVGYERSDSKKELQFFDIVLRYDFSVNQSEKRDELTLPSIIVSTVFENENNQTSVLYDIASVEMSIKTIDGSPDSSIDYVKKWRNFDDYLARFLRDKYDFSYSVKLNESEIKKYIEHFDRYMRTTKIIT